MSFLKFNRIKKVHAFSTEDGQEACRKAKTPPPRIGTPVQRKWRNRMEHRGLKLLEGVLRPHDLEGNSPGPRLKQLASNLLQCLRAGHSDALEEEFHRSWPNYLNVPVSRDRIAVIREIACGPGMHTMFSSMLDIGDKRKQLTALKLATFMCVVDDMLTLLLSHNEFLPTITRMLWNREDIREDARGPAIPAVQVRRAAIVSLSFVVREPAKRLGMTPYFEQLAHQERLGFLEKLCDLGIPAAAVANLNDREVLDDEILVVKGMLVIRVICSGANTGSGGSEKCKECLLKLRAFEAIAQHAIAPSTLRPFMLSVIETLSALATVIGTEALVDYPGLMDCIQTLWVKRQTPDPEMPPGQPWDSHKSVAKAASELVAYVSKVQGKPSPISGAEPRVPLPQAAQREIMCLCASCGRPPNVTGFRGTPPFHRWCGCMRCKVMRYCSKKCRENHWKNGHWNECVPLWLVP